MQRTRSVFRASFVVVAVAAVAFQASPAQAGIARGSFHEEKLVSDIDGLADHTDHQLVNPWGLSASPTSPMWVSDNNAGVSTLYDGAGIKQSRVVTIPAPGKADGGTPTGTVFNNTNDFQITTGTNTSKTFFFFDTEDGTLLAWNPAAGGSAKIMVDNSPGAVYKGLTNGFVVTASGVTKNYLYAANFRSGTVDVFDGQFHQQFWDGAFTDPAPHAGFAPFGIQNINGSIFVTYAKQNGDKHDDVSGPGIGFVDIYTTSGAFVSRFASGGNLNSPWGLALAPASFGNFHNDILVGNFGDGRINAFTTGGRFRGQLKSETSAPIQNDGLWGLRFGTGANAGTLYFAAGIFDESHGLFGSIVNVEN